MGKEIYNGNANENVMLLKYSELHIHLTNLGEQKRHIWKVLTERPDKRRSHLLENYSLLFQRTTNGRKKRKKEQKTYYMFVQFKH